MVSSSLEFTADDDDELLHQDWIRLNSVSRDGGSQPLRNHRRELPPWLDNVAPYLFPCLAFCLGLALTLTIFWNHGLDPLGIFAASLYDGLLYGIVLLAKRPVHNRELTAYLDTIAHSCSQVGLSLTIDFNRTNPAIQSTSGAKWRQFRSRYSVSPQCSGFSYCRAPQ
jgi:hypothetical protein